MTVQFFVIGAEFTLSKFIWYGLVSVNDRFEFKVSFFYHVLIHWKVWLSRVNIVFFILRSM